MTILLGVKSLEEKLHTIVGDGEYIHDQMDVFREMKTLVPEMKFTIDGIISRFESAKEKISVYENSNRNYSKWGTERKRRLKKNNSQWMTCSNYKKPNRGVVVAPKGEEKKEKQNIWRNNGWRLFILDGKTKTKTTTSKKLSKKP